MEGRKSSFFMVLALGLRVFPHFWTASLRRRFSVLEFELLWDVTDRRGRCKIAASKAGDKAGDSAGRLYYCLIMAPSRRHWLALFGAPDSCNDATKLDSIKFLAWYPPSATEKRAAVPNYGALSTLSPAWLCSPIYISWWVVTERSIREMSVRSS
jgi:hypothetical protein